MRPGLLVADPGASTSAHARHAVAEPWRLATAARHGRSSCVDTGVGAGRGRRGGGLGRLRTAGQKRGRGLLAPPFSLFYLF